MTDSRSLKPDARLVQLHAERGDPPARLAGALADLEGAAWGVLLSGEAALARQLAAQLGSGTLRLDARVRVNRDALADAGLAVAGLDADWRGARAVWLLEPDADTLGRAQRAGVPVIVDGTLAPGGNWLQAGAAFVAYRNSVTLTGHADAPLSALFGAGRTPDLVGAPPSDLSVALALRDVATLPLRLARAARTTSQLAARLGGAAQPAGPTALLLAPDAAADSVAASGGVLAAARSVPGGVLLTPGLEDAEAVLALLRGNPAPAMTAPDEREARREEPGRQEPGRRDSGGRPAERPEGRTEFRRERREGDWKQGGKRGERPGRFTRGEATVRPDRAEQPSRGERPSEPERFTFEAPEPVQHPAASVNAPAEETWEPEIVFSGSPAPQVTLPTPVSSGPDAPTLDTVPDVLHQPELTLEAEETASAVTAPAAPAAEEDVQSGALADAAAPLAEQEAAETQGPVVLPPDLPQGKLDPSADLTDEQAAVYARLREWRNAEAKRQEISRFIVASNATLAEIARRIPYTEADLKAVKGMGPERLRKYGEKILEVVRG